MQWVKGASNEVSLTITTAFVTPEVSLTIYRNRVVAANELEWVDEITTWPVTMDQVGATAVWAVTLEQDAFELQVGERLAVEIVFDDGDSNYKTFIEYPQVIEG